MLQFPENEKHKLFKNQSTDKDIVKLLEFFSCQVILYKNCKTHLNSKVSRCEAIPTYNVKLCTLSKRYNIIYSDSR